MKILLSIAVILSIAGFTLPLPRQSNPPFTITHQHFSPMLTSGGNHGSLANFLIINTRDKAPAFLPEIITDVLKNKGYTVDVSNGPNKLIKDGTYIGKILVMYRTNTNYSNNKNTHKITCSWTAMIYDVESSKPVEIITDNFPVPGYGEEEQTKYIREKISSKLKP